MRAVFLGQLIGNQLIVTYGRACPYVTLILVDGWCYYCQCFWHAFLMSQKKLEITRTIEFFWRIEVSRSFSTLVKFEFSYSRILFEIFFMSFEHPARLVSPWRKLWVCSGSGRCRERYDWWSLIAIMNGMRDVVRRHVLLSSFETFARISNAWCDEIYTVVNNVKCTEWFGQ